MRRLRCALYYPWVYLHGGPERAMSEVISRSRHDWTIYTNHFEPESVFPRLREARVEELAPVSVKRTFFHAGRGALRILTQRLPIDDYDALLVFCEGFGDLVLWRKPDVPAACFCMTPLRAAFDEHYQRRYLEMKGGGIVRRGMLMSSAALFRAVDQKLWKRYQRVFAVSQEIRRRIVNGGLYSHDRVEILNPGIDPLRLVPTGVYSPNFVLPGRIMWTKNIQMAIAAFRRFLAKRPDLGHFRLTVAGFVDLKSRSYLEMLRRRADGCPQITFLVSPSDEELFGATSSAYAILYPPFNEDWGLVPVEGMALGKPVIAVNRGGPIESVVHGETGFLVEPGEEAFAAAIETLAENPEMVRQFGLNARKRALQFTWDTFVGRLDDALEDIAAAHQSVHGPRAS